VNPAMVANDPFLDQVTALLPALRAFGRSLCGDPARADDLVQDTVLKAWTNRNQFQTGSNLKAWLFTILRNCYYSELRHRKFEVEDPEGVCAAQLSVAPVHDARLHLRDLNRALQELPHDQREALVLVCATGLSYEEAADVCQVAVGTIKSRIARARDRLVELLGEDAAMVTDPGSGGSQGSDTVSMNSARAKAS
jgi:RNA polymerase sigma-70 factor, ECF subfamily